LLESKNKNKPLKIKRLSVALSFLIKTKQIYFAATLCLIASSKSSKLTYGKPTRFSILPNGSTCCCGNAMPMPYKRGPIRPEERSYFHIETISTLTIPKLQDKLSCPTNMPYIPFDINNMRAIMDNITI
jgi:hypothetical protein